MAEALAVLTTDTFGEHFPRKYIDEAARTRWKSWHGELPAFEKMMVQIDPAYKKATPVIPASSSKKPLVAGGSVAGPSIVSVSPLTVPIPVETVLGKVEVNLSLDEIKALADKSTLEPSNQSMEIAEYVKELHDDTQEDVTEKIAKFLEFYANTVAKKLVSDTLSKQETNNCGGIGKAKVELIEDALVDALREQNGGPIDPDSEAGQKMLSFLYKILTRRGNLGAYDPASWAELKTKMTQLDTF